MKHFFFRHYWWIAIVTLGLLVFFVIADSGVIDWKLVVTLVGLTVSLIFFVQKQKLEELKLFKELFTEFNRRYDEMNRRLNEILRGNYSEELTEKDKSLLDDYFNLCGEEYLFYCRGYIDPIVWKAWHNGMQVFYKSPRIQKLWSEELRADSYYGLRLDK